MKTNIHHYERRLVAALAGVNEAPIPSGSRECILEFDAYLTAGGISISRRLKYLEVLRRLAQFFNKSFNQLKKVDVIRFVGDLEAKPWKAWTKATWKIAIKRFWKWLKGKKEKVPKEVDWLRTRIPQRP